VGFKELLAVEFAPFGLLSAEQLELLERHHALLARWNQRMNLTRIENLEDAVRLHYCESLFLGTQLPHGKLRIADVGSGAGFPGFPVAALRPESFLDLIESHQRKAVFLREASAGAPNVRIVGERAEAVANTYDWVISRAVLPADVLSLNLATNTAILMAQADIGTLKKEPDVVTPLPWGIGRILAMFHVEHSEIEDPGSTVSRGT
jgi:16S rRNA (guanine527-N7)-methyltransferase